MQTEFRRQGWHNTGKVNAHPLKELPSRFTLMAAIDSLGNSWLSVGSGNTDSDTFIAYLWHLCAVLKAEDPDFRRHCLFVLDNASYHRSKESRLAYKKLGLRVIFSGPYSYR